MSDVLQGAIVLFAVLGAAAYAGRRLWRTLRPAKAAGCGTDCGCATDTPSGDDWAKT